MCSAILATRTRRYLQLKAVLAAKIIDVLDQQKISVRQAHERTGFAVADFSRVRQAKLQRFTIDRLMAMLGRLDQDVEVSVDVRPRSERTPAARLTAPAAGR